MPPPPRTPHTGLTGGTTYHYRVEAENAVGTGAASNVANATTDTPTTNTPATGNPFIIGMPTPQVGQSLSASVGNINDADGTATISGTAQVGQVLTAESGTIADANGLTRPRYRYQWLRAETASGAGTAISGATGRTYTLAAADVGQYLRVRVSFTDDASHQESRTSRATPEVQAAQPPPPPRTTTPGAPAGVTVTSGDRQVTVDWSGVSGATGYTVQWKSGSEAYAAARQQRVTASRTTISGLTNGTTYTVRVRTRHAGGTSDWSAEAMVTPGPPRPRADAAGRGGRGSSPCCSWAAGWRCSGGVCPANRRDRPSAMGCGVGRQPRATSTAWPVRGR